ncbi:MAG: hypothetical protein JZU52_12675 [Lamprocystis purpurea]|jgi:hypothetical protein|uniref:hypothetical protein n=1 Tax=Lamprocystis purpurea TaxID=61598 RepID=UPI000380EE02|nr:hypothetical protein [Lamprocystis purpurea]MBV5274450.1 hypothetical protein [Lamprocystis purpurea]
MSETLLIYAPTGALAEAERVAGETRAAGRHALVRGLELLTPDQAEPCTAVRLLGARSPADVEQVRAAYPQTPIEVVVGPVAAGGAAATATDGPILHDPKASERPLNGPGRPSRRPGGGRDPAAAS